MLRTYDSEPWRGLPPRVADLIEPELDAISEEIVATIGREVPEYARPLEGRFGRGVRTGVGEALLQFVALIRDPETGRDRGREVYVELGRGELRQGRALDSLLAAYRVGARVAWRRIAAVCRDADLPVEPLTLVAESIFAYIDGLSADSAEGYAAAQTELEDVRRRRRQELAALLIREPAPDDADLRAAARAAEWTVPARLAVGACSERDLVAVTRRLPQEVLATVVDGSGCLVVPDPDGPGRVEALTRAAPPLLALGPAGGPAEAGGSWALAQSILRASAVDALPSSGLLRAEDHLAELLLFEGRGLTARIAAARLRPFEELTEKAAARMRETALAHLRHNGNAVAMASEMHVHPQTARYRIARLKELLGDQLEDPDARFELEIALRSGVA